MAGKIIRPFLKHDEDSQMDRAIAKIIHKYDYLGYGLFWSIAEYLHKNRKLEIGEEFLIRGYDKHSDIIESILKDFDLFRVEENCYVSDRILNDLEIADKKSEQARDAVSTKWLMSAFKKEYEKVFDAAPELEDEDIKALKAYNNKIANFKKLLPDILYTLKSLNFDNENGFQPRANWLLGKKNLSRLLNGEFGKLKHKKTPIELKAEQEKAKQVQIAEQESEINIESFRTKESALKYISSHCSNIRFLTPLDSDLIEKYHITSKELKQAIKDKQHENEHE